MECQEICQSNQNQSDLQSGASKKSASRLQVTVLLLIAIALLIPRLDGLSFFPGKYLWAEDGLIFINQAQSIGVASLWTPYAGYLHAYPRLIAIIAHYFELVDRPIVLFAGWVLAYIFMFFVLIRRAYNLGLEFLSILLLVILVSLQPHNGENFFNITNSQWMIGAALSILVVTSVNDTSHVSLSKLPVLILLGLTGPFSIILIPALFLKAIACKDVRKNFWEYFVVSFCAAIQAFVLVKSHRVASADIDPLPWDWIISFLQIALFGANSWIAIAASLLFWILFIYVFFRTRVSNGKWDAPNISIVLMFFAVLLFFIASLYSSKNNPMAIAALGAGNRYTWVPYSLAFFGATLASTRRSLIQVSIFAAALFINYKNFHHTLSPNLQFKSFANLSNYKNVIIPVNPQWPTYPGWHIDASPSVKKLRRLVNEKQISLSPISASGADTEFSNDKLHITSTSNDPILLFTNAIVCENASDVALEIDLARSVEGWMQLFWSKDNNFSETNSLKRWYPAGPVKAQFAFPNFQGVTYVRFDPLELEGNAEITKLTAYCLP